MSYRTRISEKKFDCQHFFKRNDNFLDFFSKKVYVFIERKVKLLNYIRKEVFMERENRYELFCHMIDELDKGVSLIEKYDSLLHDYNGVVMFQAESQMIKAIGDNPGVTAAVLAEKFGKTPSACSQIIRKLRQKQWVRREKNARSSREYNLFLTAEGREIYEKHRDSEQRCYMRTFEMLSGMKTSELESYIAVQKKLNEAFALDVSESENL